MRRLILALMLSLIPSIASAQIVAVRLSFAKGSGMGVGFHVGFSGEKSVIVTAGHSYRPDVRMGNYQSTRVGFNGKWNDAEIVRWTCLDGAALDCAVLLCVDDGKIVPAKYASRNPLVGESVSIDAYEHGDAARPKRTTRQVIYSDNGCFRVTGAVTVGESGSPVYNTDGTLAGMVVGVAKDRQSTFCVPVSSISHFVLSYLGSPSLTRRPVKSATTATAIPDGVVVTEFGFEGCKYCEEMRPTVETLRREGVTIRYVDAVKEKARVTALGISSFPAYIIERGGQSVTIVGKTSIEVLRSTIRSIVPADCARPAPSMNPPAAIPPVVAPQTQADPPLIPIPDAFPDAASGSELAELRSRLDVLNERMLNLVERVSNLPSGPQGLQGIKGDKGDVGPRGAVGETGAAGNDVAARAEIAALRREITEARTQITETRAAIQDLSGELTIRVRPDIPTTQ